LNSASEFTVVFEGSISEADHVKNILESNGMDCFLKNETLGQLFPLYGGHGAVKPVKVMVRNEEADRAKEVIATYYG
jgi:hypothetical protein